jgi:DNA-binding transcriptional ArsR family regulator
MGRLLLLGAYSSSANMGNRRFKVLANDTRIRLLHALVRVDELCVTDLVASVGIEPQAVSNQLQRLSDLGILAARWDGNYIHYRLVDVCVRSLMDQGLAVSDIALKKRPSAQIGQDLMAYVGCMSGAIPVEEYRRQLNEAGFAAVNVIDTGADLNAYAKLEDQGGSCSPAASSLKVVETACCSTPQTEDTLHAPLLDLLTRYNVNDYAASVRVFAVKP